MSECKVFDIEQNLDCRRQRSTSFTSVFVMGGR